MRKIFNLLLLMATFGLWVACEEEDYEVVVPTFKGFLYSPTIVHPGDSVRFTACYRDAGKNVYLANHKGYVWKLTLDTLNAEGATGLWSYTAKPTGSIGDGEPTIRLKVPATAKPGSTARLDFTANYSNACDGTPGKSWENKTDEGYYGTFQASSIQSIIYSGVSGWMKFGIQ